MFCSDAQLIVGGVIDGYICHGPLSSALLCPTYDMEKGMSGREEGGQGRWEEVVE